MKTSHDMTRDSNHAEHARAEVHNIETELWDASRKVHQLAVLSDTMPLYREVMIRATLLLLNAICICSSYKETINLARGKPATASSVIGPLPRVATDGLPNTDWGSGSCFAVTEGDYHPWWQVDLEAYSEVFEVAVTSRSDCCPERLHDFTLEVLRKNPATSTSARSVLCGTYNGAVTEPGKTASVKCIGSVRGRYVRLRGTKDSEGDILQFCEVKVFGSIIADGRYNLARGKPATASSVYLPLPRVATDGLPNTDWESGSCFHVAVVGDYHPWWQVDLEAYSEVFEVAVTSRSDCCTRRLHDFTLEVFRRNPATSTGARSALCGTYNGAVTEPGKTASVKCIGSVRGRYVRLSGTKDGEDDILQFCEVKVFGSIIADGKHNLARGKPATASSVIGPSPRAAIDGLPNTDWKSGSCFAVVVGDDHPWWQVDLEAYSEVFEVAVTSRSDCCPERLHDFTVEVFRKNPATSTGAGSALCGIYNGAVTEPGKTASVECIGSVRGRYVRLRGTKDGEGDLQFCEVKVFGSIITDGRYNLARGKPATASSVIGPLPRVATDGLPNTDWESGSCFAVAEGDDHPWWQVDLEAYSEVFEVAVTSRSDCCPETLHDFTLEVFRKNPATSTGAGSALCGIYNGAVTEPGKTASVKCIGSVRGRYVRLRGTKDSEGDLLQFCEVKVFGSIITDGKYNLARGKPATASSVIGPLPRVATDGLPNTDWGSGSCFAVAEGDDHPWWQVDLEAYSEVFEVAVTSRSDCCPERLHDFTLEVFRKNPATSTGAGSALCGIYNGAVTEPGKTASVKCIGSVRGRYVRLRGTKDGEGDILQFCEVKVFGSIFADGKYNLARGKPATASSVYGPLPRVATDGLPNTDWESGSCFAVAEGDDHPWWQVDLEAYSEVFEVAVTSRSDCCQGDDHPSRQVDLGTYSEVIEVAVTSRSDCCPERLHDFTLEVFTKPGARGALCGTYHGAFAEPGKTVTVKCTRPIQGRYVRLSRKKNGEGDRLQFCEVKVFGYAF
ncbi:uncharacterized protein LOC124260418 [Haliotis rubra]|uniref:uncharacterized protein LOC124260418 n=1 Tax=Haliotis rubra TaxID=36100 RepID=UPI001EE604BB|nr:uncharacterized protein LOC124260418 [Haliotis rubra]